MPTTTLTAHLSTAELGQRYRAARCPLERSHLQIVWLLSQGRSEREVAAVTGYGRRWIAEIVRRYNAEGAGGPVVDAAGQVMGTIFASTTEGKPGGYAVPNGIVMHALSDSSGEVSTGPCTR